MKSERNSSFETAPASGLPATYRRLTGRVERRVLFPCPLALWLKQFVASVPCRTACGVQLIRFSEATCRVPVVKGWATCGPVAASSVSLLQVGLTTGTSAFSLALAA